MRVKVFFAWFDLWIGVYIDRPRRIVYVCPLPTLVIKVSLPTEADRGRDDE
jgi:hypothetical protein